MNCFGSSSALWLFGEGVLTLGKGSSYLFTTYSMRTLDCELLELYFLSSIIFTIAASILFIILLLTSSPFIESLRKVFKCDFHFLRLFSSIYSNYWSCLGNGDYTEGKILFFEPKLSPIPLLVLSKTFSVISISSLVFFLILFFAK